MSPGVAGAFDYCRLKCWTKQGLAADLLLAVLGYVFLAVTDLGTYVYRANAFAGQSTGIAQAVQAAFSVARSLEGVLGDLGWPKEDVVSSGPGGACGIWGLERRLGARALRPLGAACLWAPPACLLVLPPDCRRASLPTPPTQLVADVGPYKYKLLGAEMARRSTVLSDATAALEEMDMLDVEAYEEAAGVVQGLMRAKAALNLGRAAVLSACVGSLAKCVT